MNQKYLQRNHVIRTFKSGCKVCGERTTRCRQAICWVQPFLDDSWDIRYLDKVPLRYKKTWRIVILTSSTHFTNYSSNNHTSLPNTELARRGTDYKRLQRDKHKECHAMPDTCSPGPPFLENHVYSSDFTSGGRRWPRRDQAHTGPGNQKFVFLRNLASGICWIHCA